jgi:hypothetical protein
MKNIISILIICSIGIINYAQAQETPPSNQTIIRLTVVNDNNEILMRKTQYGWMTPAVYFNERQNIREMLDSIVNVYGIKISAPNLRGLFTYKPEFDINLEIQIFIKFNRQGVFLTI